MLIWKQPPLIGKEKGYRYEWFKQCYNLNLFEFCYGTPNMIFLKFIMKKCSFYFTELIFFRSFGKITAVFILLAYFTDLRINMIIYKLLMNFEKWNPLHKQVCF